MECVLLLIHNIIKLRSDTFMDGKSLIFGSKYEFLTNMRFQCDFSQK